MKTPILRLALIASIGTFLCGGHAFAATCSGPVIFAGTGSTTEGASTLPGTSVGTVGCGATDVGQIGNLTLYNSGSGGAFVNTTHNPVNYEFYFAGGSLLTITGKIGNNGIGYAIDMALLAWDGTTATSLATMQIPFSSGPSATYTLVSNDLLDAGNYIISTSLSNGNVEDPNFQVNFSLTPAEGPGTTPLPAALPLFGTGLGALALFASSRKRKKAAAAV